MRSLRLSVVFLSAAFAFAEAPLRPPAVPLVTHDPYFSIWSFSDRLTDEPTKHWTGTEQQLGGIIRIDGKPFRFIGTAPRGVPAMEQIARKVTPTQTRYEFRSAGVDLTLHFLTPALPSDLDILSRPATYVSFDVRSSDGKQHAVSIYFDASTQLAVNTDQEQVVTARSKIGGMQVLRAGTTEQPVLGKSGDNLRIDWGHLYLTAPTADIVAGSRATRDVFARTGRLPEDDDLDVPRASARNTPVLAASFDIPDVGTSAVSRFLVLAYDDLFSIEYLNRRLRPYWRRNGAHAADLLKSAVQEYDALRERSARFDEDLTARLEKTGGPNYAALAILAFRQTLAAHKLVADVDGTPMYFSKENFSNGCIDTVDVTYPSAPFFLLFNPALLKGQLKPVMDYAHLPRWRFPFAPHDLGTYPLANGQVYGGGERTEENQMPVEESGNLLLLVAALAKAEGNADFASHYWPELSKWAAYLRDKGLDPENQLSTDDFAGHLAHNTNLSIKAISALAAYADLAKKLGKSDVAADYRRTADQMAAKWTQMADDGDHYRLAFDKPGTWSQKYNLVWDKLLGLHLFPDTVARKEMAFYKSHQKTYGLPLDNRADYTKLDWIVWTATLGDRSDFEALIDPAYRWANETQSRVPLTDWYMTTDGKQRGFQARSVVGGIFIKALADAWSNGAR
jgi:hypothetical protein